MRKKIKTVEQLLHKAYKKGLIHTLDVMEYSKRWDGIYAMDIIKKLERLLGSK